MPRRPNATADLYAIRNSRPVAIAKLSCGQDTLAAANAIRTIRDSLAKLAQRPLIGRPARGAGLPPGARQWSIRFGGSGYVALYHSDGEVTIVLAIRHAREAGY